MWSGAGDVAAVGRSALSMCGDVRCSVHPPQGCDGSSGRCGWPPHTRERVGLQGEACCTTPRCRVSLRHRTRPLAQTTHSEADGGRVCNWPGGPSGHKSGGRGQRLHSPLLHSHLVLYGSRLLGKATDPGLGKECWCPLPGEGVPLWAPLCWGLAGTLPMCTLSSASLTHRGRGGSTRVWTHTQGIKAWGC